MARLTRQRDSAALPLPAHALVGRGPAAIVRLTGRRVSADHATLRWTGERWLLRDLGSRNGTWVDGRRLGVGEEVPLRRTARLAFGDADDLWELTDAGPPAPVARSGDRWCSGDDGVLVLPGTPGAVIWEDADRGWVAERDGRERAVESGAELEIDGTRWRLWLPEELAETFDPGASLVDLDAVQLELTVSPDEEHVAAVFVDPAGRRRALKPRPYHYLLVVLADRRARDDAAVDTERGWVPRADLARMVGVNPRTLAVQLCRIRQQVGRLGVARAADVFELRPDSRTLRLGIARTTVCRGA